MVVFARNSQASRTFLASPLRRLHLPTGLAARLSQSLKKALAVAVILKEGFASIPAIHHMINRSGILDSKFSGHSRKLSPPTNMSIPLTDPEDEFRESNEFTPYA